MDIIRDPAKGLFGRNKLIQKYPQLKDKINKAYQEDRAYTINVPLRKRFQRRPTIAPRPRFQTQIDLLDNSYWSEDNDGIKFILVAIDIFTRQVWVEPIKNKTAQEVLTAFKNIISRSGRFDRVQSDDGTEFLNSQFQKYLKDNHIFFFTTSSDVKASIVERFHRTLRTLIKRYMDYNNTRRYIDVLQAIVSNYNNTIHRSIGMSPNDAEIYADDVKTDQEYKLQELEASESKKNYAFDVGDIVRISRQKDVFEKSDRNNYSVELFKIHKVLDTVPITYKVKDLNDEVLKGSFYPQELVKTVEPEVYEIEKILSTRRRAGKVQVLVKYIGYPDKFNQWINESDLIDI